MPVVRTVAEAVQVEIPRIKGSRFVADVAPAADDAAREAVLTAVREAFPDASHHCWGWVGGGDVRSSDDGEPAGTAGEPIARRIAGDGLEGVVVVVTRWFGGTKLGTGGLVRAYGEAARAGLDAAAVVERRVTARVALTYAYDDTGAVRAALAAWDLDDAGAVYGADVALSVDVPVEHVDALIADVVERTAGRVQPVRA